MIRNIFEASPNLHFHQKIKDNQYIILTLFFVKNIKFEIKFVFKNLIIKKSYWVDILSETIPKTRIHSYCHITNLLFFSYINFFVTVDKRQKWFRGDMSRPSEFLKIICASSRHRILNLSHGLEQLTSGIRTTLKFLVTCKCIS